MWQSSNLQAEPLQKRIQVKYLTVVLSTCTLDKCLITQTELNYEAENTHLNEAKYLLIICH